jgi:hypothetical protein
VPGNWPAWFGPGAAGKGPARSRHLASGLPVWRLRLNGLIRRLPHTNRYVLTADGIRIAVFYTKIYNRLLVPLTAANQPQAPPELRAALAAITRHVDDYANRARMPRAA